MRKSRAKIEFPDDFVLTDELRTVFRKWNPAAGDGDITTQWAKFEAHHKAEGSQFKLWTAAWSVWSINAKLYGFAPAVSGPYRIEPKPAVDEPEASPEERRKNQKWFREFADVLAKNIKDVEKAR
jgi:hypothetical protein